MTDFLQWQLIDSAFPNGSFAHSGGLEAAVQQQIVATPACLADFIRAGLKQGALFSLPMLLAAASDPTQLREVDHQCDVLLNNHVANRASRVQGKALLASVTRTFATPALMDLQQSVRQQALAGHQAPIFGAVGAALGIDAMRVAELYTFQLLRGWVSAGVRLGVVGPLEAQQLQSELAECAATAVTTAAQISLDEIGQSAPMLDLLQANHDRLYSRLFQS
jgi:urease accessory protein